jgi:hypothetical protein
MFIWEGTKGFGLMDEGYLWYGAQRVLQGAVPLRDFLAYDPGRYYWSAAILRLASDSGIVSLRAGIALFQILGLSIALVLIGTASSRSRRGGFAYSILCSVILVLWMIPRHKIFDISVSICLVGALTCLVNNPTRRNYFFAGVVVGLAAVFGRNHGVYGAVGSIAVLAWLFVGREHTTSIMQGFFYWIVGVAAGFSPLAIMLIVIPGFSSAFWESIRFLFEFRATNLPLPIPWPWRVNFANPDRIETLRAVLTGIYFICLPLFAVLAVITVFWRRWNKRAVEPVLVAGAILSLPYAHYAFSRAELGHLAQGAFPALIGVLTMLACVRPLFTWIAGAVLVATSLITVTPEHPGWQCGKTGECVSAQIGDNRLEVNKGVAADVNFIQNLVQTYANENNSFIAAPFWPGAYAMFDRRAPVWEIFPIVPRPPPFEEAEIKRIETARPSLIIIVNAPLDDQEDLRYSNTHPLTYHYIQEHFTRIRSPRGEPYEIYVKPQN